MRLRPPVPRRSPSTDVDLAAASDGRVRVLTDADTPALTALAAADPVANVHAASLLEAGRLAGPRGGRADGTLFLGAEDPDRPGALRSACWVGSTVVPLAGHDDDVPALAASVAALRRRFASVYGPAATVLAVGRTLRDTGHRPRAVREEQPLMVHARTPWDLVPDPAVRSAAPGEWESVVPASAAMFEEELGFSPFLTGAAQYRDRVRRLVADGRVFTAPGEPVVDDPTSGVRFKADIGLLSASCVQVQGVWLHPSRRGRGEAASAMAAAVALMARRAPAVSLYVNGFNTPALRTYERVGFERVGTFATVLY